MAKTRRRMPRAPRRRRDWVYRPNLKDTAGGLFDVLGSYENLAKNLAAGFANPQVAVLYDSSSYMSAVAAQTTTFVALPRASRAEGRKPLIHRVQGVVLVTPSTWAAGSRFDVGFRFGRFVQAPDTGGIVFDPEYAMWGSPADAKDSPANYANDTNWQFERRELVTFGTSNDAASWKWSFNFRVNRSLESNQAYALYMESAGGSININIQCWFRTLVSDEG